MLGVRIMSEVVMPNLQKDKIEAYLRESGKRLDGRKAEDYREISVEEGVSLNSASAVRVKVGKTEVLAGVHLAPAVPYPDSPDEGTFMTSAELHPMASNYFDIGRPGINAIELSRVIDRGIRESGFIDFKGLCIKEGEKVWQVFVDIVAVNDDGNLLDVAGLAAIIALGKARMPIYNEEEDKVEDGFSDEGIPLNKDVLSFSMTFHKVGETIVADVSSEEEVISKFRLTIAVGDNEGQPRITAMQKGKAGTINDSDMETILKLAESKWTEMFPKVKEHCFG
jgi:exosome complex component RRP42